MLLYIEMLDAISVGNTGDCKLIMLDSNSIKDSKLLDSNSTNSKEDVGELLIVEVIDTVDVMVDVTAIVRIKII